MIQVAAITSGIDTPSARYRIRQHVEPLRDAGIFVHECRPRISKYAPLPFFRSGKQSRKSPAAEMVLRALWTAAKLGFRLPAVLQSWHSQITWLERELISGMPSLEPFIKRPYVFDVDDAIWLLPPFGQTAAKKIARHASVVMAGNAYIADWFSSHARQICIIPTAVDTDTLKPVPICQKTKRDAPFRFCWIGTSGNYVFLKTIEKELLQFLADNYAEFWVVSDSPPDSSLLSVKGIRYFSWSPEIEAAILPRADVGLMPLGDDAWSLGKCSYKMLQYMACGLPVIVTPIGMNAEILALGEIGFGASRPGDWYDALSLLLKDNGIGISMGNKGREIAMARFGRTRIAAVIAETFKKIHKS